MGKKKSESKGHYEHSGNAEGTPGLPGTFSRPIKLTFMGAGSGFCPTLMNDLFKVPGIRGGEIVLVDIDRNRLKAIQTIVQKLADQHPDTPWTISATPNRRTALPGSHYIVNCIEVSGLACVGFDDDIPRKYGVDQCIGDTMGPGGLFKALRTIPVWLDILRDAEELCPDAIVLNYTNPMNMMCLAAGMTSSMQVVGLCHSVQGTSHELAARVGIPYDELTFDCAGINHLAWFTTLEHNGRNLYPRLKKQAQEELYGDPAKSKNKRKGDAGRDRVRKDMLLHFGAAITESSGHLSEYLPYYRVRGKDRRFYLRKEYEGGSGFYRKGWPTWRKQADTRRREMAEGKREPGGARSWEYGSWIIEAREKNTPHRIYGNVMNQHKGGGPLIGNLNTNGCVELACMIDENGVQPVCFGSLPPQMAAVSRSNMSLFELGAIAAIEKSKEAAIHALMLDPLTSACCAPADIQSMAQELFNAEKKYLKGFR